MYPANQMSQEFNKYYNAQKKAITKMLSDKGCTNMKFNRGYYCFSAFFTTKSGKVGYVFTTDYRSHDYRMIVRTAKNYTDFTGGRNNWFNEVSELETFVTKVDNGTL